MKVLVTGGAGFIGSHTTDLLVKKGFKVRVFDSLEPQVHGGSKPDYMNDQVEFMTGDITNKDSWKKALTGVDAVIHLAALVGMGQSMYQPVRYLMINTIGTANMYEVLIENPDLRKNIKSIVSASSKSIYGEGAYTCKDCGLVYPGPRPVKQLEAGDWEVHCPKCDRYVEPTGITEDKPVQNLAAYALGKYDTERLTMMFGDTLGIPSTSFRYFNVFGPRQSLSNPYTGVAAIFMSRVKNDNQPLIYEDGKMIRDFIYVEDIAAANVLGLEKIEGTDVFNVGAGNVMSIADIARTIIKLSGKDMDVNITNKFRAGDNRHDFSDITKIKKKLGFKPKWSFKDGMRELIEWSETQTAVDKFEIAEKERLKYLGK
jgi:dTDP-L-rhamnose 4-epimerase